LKYYCSLLLFVLTVPVCAAQVLSNNGAVVSVAAGTEVNVGTVDNGSGSIINNGTIVLGNVANQSGASFINYSSILIGGSITNSGTFDSKNGSVAFNGASAQTISAGAFSPDTVRDLTVNNSAGVSLADSLKISNYLKADVGNFNSAGYLTLLSTPTETALIDWTGAGSVLGNVTMQRYLASGFGYHYISSPFQSATVAGLADDINLADTFSNIYRYDETLLSAGWVNHSLSTNPLNPVEGYAINCGNSSAAKTIDISGVVNDGNTSSNTISNNNNTYTQGFNLVGNPFPSPIDWDINSGWTRPKVDDAIYYFNASPTDRYGGTYSSYINGVSSDGIASNIIASMQGFFVHVNNGSTSITVKNTARVNSLSPVFHKQAGSNDKGLVRISVEHDQSNTVSDAAVVYFDEHGAHAFQEDLDALKMLNTDKRVPNLYIVSGERKLAINAIAQPSDATSAVPLELEVNQNGGVTFKVRDIENLPAGLHVYLADAETGIIQDLEQMPVYQQDIGKGVYSNRFYLMFSRQDRVSIPGSEPLTMFTRGGSLFVTTTEDKGELLVTNSIGQVVKRELLSGAGIHEVAVGSTGTGLYIVSLSTARGKKSGKVVLGRGE
jgi:fibronectin-binding autotransporter adhesin